MRTRIPLSQSVGGHVMIDLALAKAKAIEVAILHLHVAEAKT